jgi:hypothetical protein
MYFHWESERILDRLVTCGVELLGNSTGGRVVSNRRFESAAQPADTCARDAIRIDPRGNTEDNIYASRCLYMCTDLKVRCVNV